MEFKNYMAKPNAKPLDKILDDGGYTAIFRKIGIVGDSLASGEFEATKGNETLYIDMYDYSWGAFIGRACGSEIVNFSRGGMTAKEFAESWGAVKHAWNEEKKCQAYIIALGVNDLFYAGKDTPMGSLDDICLEDREKNKQTVVGYYAWVLDSFQKLQPDAKFFLTTMPKLNADEEELEGFDLERRVKRKEWAEIINGMAKMFPNTYVIDLHEHAPIFDREFYKFFGLGGHLNPMGYQVVGKMISTYIDWIIRNNANDFKTVGFIGTEYKNERVKKTDGEVK